jgi:hypothetical protein
LNKQKALVPCHPERKKDEINPAHDINVYFETEEKEKKQGVSTRNMIDA